MSQRICFAFHLELKIADFLLQVEIVGSQVGIAAVRLVQFTAKFGDLVFLSSQRRALTLRQLQSVQQPVLQRSKPLPRSAKHLTSRDLI